MISLVCSWIYKTRIEENETIDPAARGLQGRKEIDVCSIAKRLMG